MESHKKIKNGIVGIFKWIATVLITVLSVYVFLIIAWRGYQSKIWLPIAEKHFAAVIGLPMAAVASLFLVLVLEYVTGEIEFEIAGVKFKGAAGQIIFWVICFLSIVVSIKLLWPLEESPALNSELFSPFLQLVLDRYRYPFLVM